MEGALLLALQAIRIEGLTQVMCVFYALGNQALLWVLVALVLFPFAEKRATSVLMLLAIVITLVVASLVLANVVARPRPASVVAGLSAVPGVSRRGFSFPCIPAAVSFAAALCMTKTLGHGWGMPSFALAAIISFSALYLGVSYLSDVVGGAVLGLLVAWVVTFIYQRVFGDVRRRRGRHNGKHSL